eukprot:Gb_08643 [translate_table: standard]
MIVTWSNVCGQGTKSVKWCLITPVQLFFHILWNLMQWDMTRPFIHYLHILLPSTTGELTLSSKLCKLCSIICIINRTRPQAISYRESNIILITNVQDVIPMFISKILLMICQTPLCMNRTSSRYNTSHSLCSQRNKTKQNTSMYCKVINSLFSLFNQSISKDLPSKILCNSIHLLKSLIYWNRAHGYRRIAQNPFTCFMNMTTC